VKVKGSWRGKVAILKTLRGGVGIKHKQTGEFMEVVSSWTVKQGIEGNVYTPTFKKAWDLRKIKGSVAGRGKNRIAEPAKGPCKETAT